MTEPTLFFRLLDRDDKAAALAEEIDGVHEGWSPVSATYSVEPSSFRRVPTSPFAYWASDRMRRLFIDLPPFEGEGRTVKQGLATADDFRFVRAWWEVTPAKTTTGPAETTLEAFRQQTTEGRRWSPFAKGGEYSPYYADIHLVVNWGSEGEEVKAYICKRYEYLNGKWEWVAKNTDYYFRPGLTWPRRTQGGLSFRALPAGCVFADKGPAAFASQQSRSRLLGITNSTAFFQLVTLQMAFGSYEVGVIQRTPIPDIGAPAASRLGELALACVEVKRDVERAIETSHVFHLPALLRTRGDTLADRLTDRQREVDQAGSALAQNQAAIDNIAYRLYDISDDDRAAIEASRIGGTVAGAGVDEDDAEDSEDAADVSTASSVVGRRSLVADLLSHAVGCTFGRWDVRFATGERSTPELPDPFAPLPVCSPGMLQGEDGLPLSETPQGYPLRIGWDGVLVDDPGHGEDIVRRVREVLELLFGERAEGIEREACEILGVRGPREYFQNPGGFFADHVKRYSKSRRKAPIYWLLQSPKRSYGVWLYYHRLDRDTVFVVLRHCVEPKINGEMAHLQDMSADLEARRASLRRGEQTRLEKEIDRQEALIAELGTFKAALERVADLGYDPDLDDGVVLNAAPFREVMPWREAKACWDDLEAGKYAWSTISKRRRARGVIRGG